MAITVKHKFVSAIPDAGDTSVVQPSNWNDSHDLTGLGTMAEQNANAVAITGGTIELSASTTSTVPLHIDAGVEPTSAGQGDIWVEGTGLYYHNSVYTNQLNIGANNAGVLDNPVITVAGSGATIDVSSVKAVLFSLPSWLGDYKEYVIPAATGLALTDNSANYLIVSYNAGSPVYSITTNPAIITNSDVVGACLLWRDGTEVHYQAIDWGRSTASRTNRRLVQTNRYQRASGLALGESTGSVITLTAGNVWYGVSEIIEGAVTSSSNNADFYYHVAGVYTKSTVSTYNNTQYDTGTALATLSAGRYAVNWVYRYLDGSGLPKLAYVLGGGNYTQAQAIASLIPTPPPILSTMAILVGRIIVLKSAATAFQIDSAFTQVFSSTTVTSHNDLSGLQGGTTDEYYHLTSAQYTVSTQSATAARNGYLTSTDWTTFNNKGSGTVTSIVAGTGLSGGTITSSGTIAIDSTVVTLTGTQTLTNKTVTGFTETVYAATGTTPALSPTNGTIQTWTLSGNSTPTAGTWAAGASLSLQITASTYTITWSSVPVTWIGGSAPTLSTTVTTNIELWKIGSTIYGALVGSA